MECERGKKNSFYSFFCSVEKKEEKQLKKTQRSQSLVCRVYQYQDNIQFNREIKREKQQYTL